jgi:hypothetical protein
VPLNSLQLVQFRLDSLDSLFLRRFAGATTERHALGYGQSADVYAPHHPVLWSVRAESSRCNLPLNQTLSGRFYPRALLRMPPWPLAGQAHNS